MSRCLTLLALVWLLTPLSGAEPWLGAYVHMAHCFDASAPEDEREASIASVLDDMKRSGLRIIVPYATTSAGEAHYRSEIVPKKSFGNWDLLGVFVREARARGLEVWPAVPMLVCGHDAPMGILAEHPDWALRGEDGEPLGYISPASPEARAWLVSVVAEIVTRYQPDGLILDYLRYPNRPADLDVQSRLRFLERSESEEYDLRDRAGTAFQAFKEECLTELMRAIHERVQSISPGVQIGIYTWGAHVSQGHYVAQPWPAWVREGYLNVVNVSGYCYPRNYGDDFMNVFRSRLRAAAALVEDSPNQPVMTFALGVRTSHGEVESSTQIKTYMDAAAEEGFDGVAVFTLSYLLPYLDACLAEDYLGAFTSGVSGVPQVR